jgi:ribosomal protein L29
MKKEKFTDKADAELVKLLAEKREELRKLRFGAAGARAKDPSALGKLRKDIARIETIRTARA